MTLLALLFVAYMVTMGAALVMDWWHERGRAKRRYETLQERHENLFARVRAGLDKKREP